MVRVRIKFCGMRTRADTDAAVGAGADAVGFNFHEPSRRYIAPVAACDITRAMPAFVTRVGLLVNRSAAEVRDIIDAVPLDLLQFSGDEDPAWCAQFGLPFVPVVHVQPTTDVSGEISAAAAAGAASVQLDTGGSGVFGGTGRSFDWRRVPRERPLPVILAGGLTPGNVAEAISIVRPFAVDVSGGIESEPGVKSMVLMEQFAAAVAGSIDYPTAS